MNEFINLRLILTGARLKTRLIRGPRQAQLCRPRALTRRFSALFKLAIAVCALLCGAASVSAQDWPQWRGPDRDGKVTGFTAPQTWPAKLTQQWKVDVGIGDSTPALVGDRIYAFGRVDANEVVRCLDAGSGKVLWEQSYPAGHVVTGPPSAHPGTRSSPAVANGRICTLGVGGILSCLDASDGHVLWRKQSTNDYLGADYDFDTSLSPIIVNELCVVDIGGKDKGTLIAFDLVSGEPKWKLDGDAPSSASPVVMTVEGQKQLVTLTAKHLIGVSLSDGREFWRVPFAAQQGNNASPVIDGQTVIYTGQSKGISAVKIEQQAGTFAATPVWSNPHYGARFTTPILHDGLLFGFNGHYFCVNANTGEDRWIEDASHGNSAALVDAGAVLFGLSVNSELVAFKPDEKQYTELARYKVADTETWAHPIVAGQRVFIRDHDSVALWTFE